MAIIPVVAGIIQIGSQYGEVLLKKHGKCECHGGQGISEKYEFPGGKVEVGESLEDALYREIKEETGIEIDIRPESDYKPRVIHAQINKYEHSPDYYLVVYMECYSRYGMKVEKIPDSVIVTLKTIQEYDTLPGTIEALRQI